MLAIPNLPHESVPDGQDDSENRVVREDGRSRRAFDFEPKPHWELGERWASSTSSAASRSPGSRFYVLHGAGARLQRALITFMLDLHTREHGYTEVYPPYMVKGECMVGTGQLPKFADNLYRDAEEDFWFVPTAEVPVTNLYRDEILPAERAADQPRRLHRLLPAREDVGRARRARHQARPPVRQGGDGEVRAARDLDAPSWTR